MPSVPMVLTDVRVMVAPTTSPLSMLLQVFAEQRGSEAVMAGESSLGMAAEALEGA